MPKRIANSTLNASTLDIMNVIRQNASYEYQQSVPEVTQWNDIPKVGEIIYGTPAFANQFINALVNRIAAVRVQSATFNNPYSILKKGYIEFGETIEDIFVNIAKVIDYNAEKGEEREFKRNLPDVRSVFHTMNWRVVYPVTIQDEDLKLAFLSGEGIQNLIARIVDSVYTAAEYDEFLLFKYLLIKAASHGKMRSDGVTSNIKQNAVRFRAISNKLPFMSSNYNESGVKTNTPKDRQIIFMDANFNANFDVEILAGAFNMEKADFMGRLFLIDDWTTFDNERFNVIRSASDGLEEVTKAELTAMADVKAILLDENWFQIYDNNNKFTEKYVSSGLYWNYFYHTWKTISYSPFANAVMFTTAHELTAPDSFTATVTGVDVSDDATVINIVPDESVTARDVFNIEFITPDSYVENGIAVQKYGSIMIPSGFASTLVVQCKIGNTLYTCEAFNPAELVAGTSITFNKHV